MSVHTSTARKVFQILSILQPRPLEEAFSLRMEKLDHHLVAYVIWLASKDRSKDPSTGVIEFACCCPRVEASFSGIHVSYSYGQQMDSTSPLNCPSV